MTQKSNTQMTGTDHMFIMVTFAEQTMIFSEYIIQTVQC